MEDKSTEKGMGKGSLAELGVLLMLAGTLVAFT
jgi:hypothetical protein